MFVSCPKLLKFVKMSSRISVKHQFAVWLQGNYNNKNSFSFNHFNDVNCILQGFFPLPVCNTYQRDRNKEARLKLASLRKIGFHELKNQQC